MSLTFWFHWMFQFKKNVVINVTKHSVICKLMQKTKKNQIKLLTLKTQLRLNTNTYLGPSQKHTHTHTRLTALFPGLPG